MTTPAELREMGPDMYGEPGHATLRRLIKEDREWALNRLVAEKQRADEAEAKLAALTAERDELVGQVMKSEAKVTTLTADCAELMAMLSTDLRRRVREAKP